MEEGRNPIIIRGFVKSNVEYWVQEAQKHWNNKEPVISFICAWIAFDYCYSLFWTNLLKQPRGSSRNLQFPCLFGFDYWEATERYVPDHVQIATFINKGTEPPAFTLFWEAFKAWKGGSLIQKIELPVLHLGPDTPVPDATPQTKRLIDLEDITPLFQVLVTIRNNLFHGGKKFTTNRSERVCSCAAEFMVPFVTELVENIKE